MNISWHGQYTLKILTHGKVLVIDPHSPKTGLPPLSIKADIVSLSHPSLEEMSHVSGIKGDPIIINTPGEFSIDQASLYARGWHDKNNNERNLQRWQIENMTLLHLGALDRDLKDLELQELEDNNIDILFLPVGGKDSLNTDQALKLLTTVEPRLVIPIHYQIPKLKKNLSSVDQFAKEMGVDPRNSQDRLNVSASKLPSDGLETILLSP